MNVIAKINVEQATVTASAAVVILTGLFGVLLVLLVPKFKQFITETVTPTFTDFRTTMHDLGEQTKKNTEEVAYLRGVHDERQRSKRGD